jgi:hypothetical protein
MIPDLQIRRSGHIVQDRLLRSLRWADIPQLSVWDAPCSAAWLQSWRPGANSRSSADQAGHIPRLARIVRALCAVAGCWPPVAAAGHAVTVAVSRALICAVLSSDNQPGRREGSGQRCQTSIACRYQGHRRPGSGER